VLQIDAHARPRRRRPAHRIDEDVRRLQVLDDLRMTLLPGLHFRERIVLAIRARNFNQRMLWNTSPCRNL
jgi:hypothetical protein